MAAPPGGARRGRAGRPVHWVDAFTDRPFTGNPAAVCRLPAAADAGWMQAVAREMNLSETAFLVPRPATATTGGAASAGAGWDLRWFTPTVEVALCGHATLASAHVLWSEGDLAPERPASFHTLSGVLTARRTDRWIELDFPALPPRPVATPAGLAEALGATPRWVGAVEKELGRGVDLLVEVAGGAEAVRGLAPDLAALARLAVRGVLVTAAAGPDGDGVDFVSRCFFPAVGIPEDPVTGSAHCVLGPYWAERLGRDEVVGYQASARGGTVGVRVAGDRTLLTGQAVTVARGELLA